MSQWHSRFVSPVYVGSCGGHACSDSARAHGRLRRVSFLSTALHSTASFTDNACVGVWVLGVLLSRRGRALNLHTEERDMMMS